MPLVKILRKILKTLVISAGVLAVLFVFLLWIKRPRTPDIRNSSGRRPADGVAALEKVHLGGWPQWILIRGEDRTHPVLLFLHGGPGMPMMYLAHTFQRPLEEHFVCVQWDQRGAGKSYSSDIPPETLTVTQILADALELIDMLRARFGKEKIFLAGHSWGSYLGMQLVARHPDKIKAYIGIGQVVDEARAQEMAADFLRRKAIETGDQEALLELDTRGPAVFEKWLFKYGAALYGKTGYAPFIWAGLKAPEYGLFDIRKVARGSSFSSRHMEYDALSGPLIDNVTEVKVPVVFFAGRHDYTTPSELVKEYLGRLKAPLKRMVWFERSAHFPFFSESEKFVQEAIAFLNELR
jgi:pimeloyl-ACP methyl ester carboxylesterase